MTILLTIALICAHCVTPCYAEGVHTVRSGKLNFEMYDAEYFPTPGPVISQMIAPYLDTTDRNRTDKEALRNLTILDPSAGTGSILNRISGLFFHEAGPTLHAIEINPDMHAGLREKFSFVHDDFLTFTPTVRYDLILMNPPFSNGDQHLEKAWDVMEHGDIVCLLNAETIRNPYTERRKWLVRLIQEHGSVEYIGAAFKTSERTTGVEVALVRLTKVDERGGFQFWEDEEFTPDENAFKFGEEEMGNMPAVNNKIAVMVQQYKLSQQSYVEYLKARKRLMHHGTPLVNRFVSTLSEIIAGSVLEPTGTACFNKFSDSLQRHAWDAIIQNTKISDLMSAGVRADFAKMQQQQGGAPFTEANIQALLQLLFNNRHVILQKCVEEAFDQMTSYHKDNVGRWGGWKTNDPYKVNRKVIMPDWCLEWRKDYGGSWHTRYGHYHKWGDIDRAIAMLEGKTLSDPTSMPGRTDSTDSYGNKITNKIYTIHDALEERTSLLNHAIKKGTYTHYVDNVCESEYFHIKFWKKGTIHLVFKDESLWERFNQQAALGKQWLPMNPDHVPKPERDPAEARYAKRLFEINMENRKLMLTA